MANAAAACIPLPIRHNCALTLGVSMLVLIVGPSGAGKDTLLNGSRAALADQPSMRFVRRVITRPIDPSAAEMHDTVSEQAFAALLAAGAFALSWRAHGLHYGIPADITIDLSEGRLVVANVSRTVVAEAAERFPVQVIEIIAPPDTLARRLAARGRDDALDIARRLSRQADLPLPARRKTIVNDGTEAAGITKLTQALRRLVLAR